MRYVAARVEKERRDRAYRIYVTDSLQLFLGLDKRYVDIVSKAPIRNADPEEIKNRIGEKLDQLGRSDE